MACNYALPAAQHNGGRWAMAFGVPRLPLGQELHSHCLTLPALIVICRWAPLMCAAWCT